MRAIYIIAVLAWLSYTALHPWFTAETLGVSYGPDGAFGLVVAQGTLGVMLAGFVTGLWYRFRRDQARDGFLLTASAVSLGLLVAWIALVVFAVMSMGLALTEPAIVCGILAFGVVLGLLYGFRQCVSWVPAAPPVDVQNTSALSTAHSTTMRGPRSGLGGLAWFAVGLLIAVVLSIPVLMLDAAFPQPPRGEWGLRPHNLWTGPLLWLVGVGVTAVLWRFQLRPLGIGVGLGTLAIGLLVLNA